MRGKRSAGVFKCTHRFLKTFCTALASTTWGHCEHSFKPGGNITHYRKIKHSGSLCVVGMRRRALKERKRLHWNNSMSMLEPDLSRILKNGGLGIRMFTIFVKTFLMFLRSEITLRQVVYSIFIALITYIQSMWWRGAGYAQIFFSFTKLLMRNSGKCDIKAAYAHSGVSLVKKYCVLHQRTRCVCACVREQ